MIDDSADEVGMENLKPSFLRACLILLTWLMAPIKTGTHSENASLLKTKMVAMMNAPFSYIFVLHTCVSLTQLVASHRPHH